MLHSTWELFLTRDWTRAPALEVQSLNRWTTRDVPNLLFKKKKRKVISEGADTCWASLCRALTLCKSNAGIETEHLSYLCSCPDKTESGRLCPLHWGRAWGQGEEESMGAATQGGQCLETQDSLFVGLGRNPGVSCWTVRGSSLPQTPPRHTSSCSTKFAVTWTHSF